MPLAKLSPDDPATVEVFECCINGQEIAPGYTEQNDPIAPRHTLEHQAGGEQQKPDFLVALEHGLPPAGGLGFAPVGPPWWRRTLTARASMSRPPMTS